MCLRGYNEDVIGRSETDFVKEDLTDLSKYHESDKSSRFYETSCRLYSGIFIRRTHHKADISIRRTVNLGTQRFPGQTLIRKSL